MLRVPKPADWVQLINQPQTEAELEAVRLSLARGCPLGAPVWHKRVARRLGVEFTLRPPGVAAESSQLSCDPLLLPESLDDVNSVSGNPNVELFKARLHDLFQIPKSLPVLGGVFDIQTEA
jgi:hypothetical protein